MNYNRVSANLAAYGESRPFEGQARGLERKPARIPAISSILTMVQCRRHSLLASLQPLASLHASRHVFGYGNK